MNPAAIAATDARAPLGLASSLIAAVLLALGTVCLVNGARRVGAPFPGFFTAENRIIVSIGRPGWAGQDPQRLLFATVLAVDGKAVVRAESVDAHARSLPLGTPVTYTVRKGADVRRVTVPTQPFEFSDFLSVYGIYFLTGLCFAAAGWWVAQRWQGPGEIAFFVTCQTVATVLLTGGDVYGPYWFTPLYFTAHVFAPATVLHLACSHPVALGYGSRTRRIILTSAYGAALVAALVFSRIKHHPEVFLPTIYSFYLLLANALLLYIGHLVIAWWGSTQADETRRIRRALGALLLSATVPGVIFVIYPVLHAPISPILVVAPLALFPLLTAGSFPSPRQPTGPTAIRLRLSLLFLGAVETTFFAAILFFWASQSWQQLLEQVILSERLGGAARIFLREPTTAATLPAIDALVQTHHERELVRRAAMALADNDTAAARKAIGAIAKHQENLALHLEQQRNRLARFELVMIVALVLLGLSQALLFMAAVRRWLIRPVEELAVATDIIATGNLTHRVHLGRSSGNELVMLGDSINQMAASLDAIQQRVASEREARHVAASTARDQERRRVASELHDGALQDLGAIKLGLEATLRASPERSAGSYIDKIISVIVDLRRIVDDLAGTELGVASVSDAILFYAQPLTAGRGIELHTEIDPDVNIARWAQRDVYRIAQEALTNAVRHGAPTRIDVRLQRFGDDVRMEIEDNGVGFTLGQVTLGTGILGMRERALAIGAALDISATPGRGTRIRLTIPRMSTVPESSDD